MLPPSRLLVAIIVRNVDVVVLGDIMDIVLLVGCRREYGEPVECRREYANGEELLLLLLGVNDGSFF